MKVIKFCLVLIFMILTSCRKDQKVVKLVTQYPQSLAELPIDTDSEIQMGPNKSSRKGLEETIKNTRKYRYLCYTYPKNRYYPFWLYSLGINLQNIDENNLAFFEFNKLLAIDSVAQFPDDIKRISNLSELQELPNALYLKLAAKLGKTRIFEKLSKTYTPKNNYSMLQTAYAYALFGNNREAINILHKAIQPESHMRLQKRSSTTAGAVCLAFCFNYHEQIDLLIKWIENYNFKVPPKEYSTLNDMNQPDTYSFRQWQSSIALINKFKELSTEIYKFKFSNLKNGSYEGKCRGFVDTLTVQILVSDNVISDIKVISSKEDRPHTALEIIPRRILNNKSLQVDAITSATITSSAIIAATVEANIKAQKKRSSN